MKKIVGHRRSVTRPRRAGGAVWADGGHAYDDLGAFLSGPLAADAGGEVSGDGGRERFTTTGLADLRGSGSVSPKRISPSVK